MNNKFIIPVLVVFLIVIASCNSVEKSMVPETNDKKEAVLPKNHCVKNSKSTGIAVMQK